MGSSIRRPTPNLLIVPAARRDAANALLQRLGYGPDNFSIPMGPARGGITHYASDVPLVGLEGAGITQRGNGAIPGWRRHVGSDRFADANTSQGLVIKRSE